MIGDENYGVAARFIEVIRRIARQEIEKIRPAARYAEVVSIDREDRSIQALFPGEQDSVRIPLLDVIPSTTGQTVQISGLAGDRAVTGIRGTNDVEARIASAEAELDRLAPCFGQWYRPSDVALTSGLYTLTWLGTEFPTVGGINLLTSDTFELPTDGYYAFDLTITTSTGVNQDIYLQIIPASGAAAYDLAHLSRFLTASSLDVRDFTMSTHKKKFLLAGDKVKVNLGTADNLTLFSGVRTHFSIQRLYKSPQIG